MSRARAGCDHAGRRGRNRAWARLTAAVPGFLPALRESLTSSTFSSSRVGSSTIPGMTAAAATLTRCPRPCCPSPSSPLWVSETAQYHLRMRFRRRASAVLWNRWRRQSLEPTPFQEVYRPRGAGLHLGSAHNLLVVIVTQRLLKLGVG